MAKPAKSKSSSTGRNPDRRNGKAWKKNKDQKPKVRTPERKAKDEMILEHRARRREEGMARHAAFLKAMREASELEEAERKAAEEAAEVARQLIISSRKKPHVPKLKPVLV